MRATIPISAAAALLACACRAGHEEEAAPAPAGAVAAAEDRMQDEGLGALLEEADGLFRARDYDGARARYEECARRAEDAGARSVRAQAMAQVARMLSIRGELEQGRPWIEGALRLAAPEDAPAWIRTQKVRGIFQREDGQAAAAVATFEALYEYRLAHDERAEALDAAHHVALAAPELATRERWSLATIELAKERGLDGWCAMVWNNLGWSYEEAGRLEDALAALEQARTYHYRSGGDHQKLVADYSVAHLLRRLGRDEEARALVEPTLAWAERRHAEAPTGDTAEWVGWCAREVGELEAAAGRPGEGLEWMRRAREHLVAAGIETWGADLLAEHDRRIAALEAAAGGG